MDQCTHEVRAEYWRKIIQACSQRPAGQSAKNWMDENGISEQSYYHWHRRFRRQAYEEMKEYQCEIGSSVGQHQFTEGLVVREEKNGNNKGTT